MEHAESTLLLSIAEDGKTELSINGITVELVEEIRIEITGNLKPRVKVIFASTRGLPAGSTKYKVLNLVHRYRELLESHPCVEIFDTAETLPFMRAVNPNSTADTTPPGSSDKTKP